MTPEEVKKYRITAQQQMLSSCTGALLTATMVTPLDVVKIRLQSQQKASLFESNRCFLYCNGLMDHICQCVNGKVNVWVKRPAQFSSTLDAFSKIIRYEGPLSLWSGLPPTLVMAVPATMVYFVTFEQLRVYLEDMYKERTGLDQPIWIPLIAGSVARTWAVTVVNPLELVRTKMQSKRLTYSELLAACSSLYKAKGIKGFWLGWSPSIMRDVPFSAIYWTSYETLKRIFDQKQPHFTFSFLAGATAGSIAGTLTLPFDVVKTHKQIELGESNFAENTNQKLSTTGQVLKKIYQAQGVRGLFTGFVPRLIKVAPACAIMLSTYEYGKSFFLRYNMEKASRTNK